MAKAADEFLNRCAESDVLPDVFEFLSLQEGLPERAQLEVLLVDQFQRWKRNQVIPVDQYLDRARGISDVLKVELLVEEFGYLEQRGIAPNAEEFASRYSSLSAAARQELYEALEITVEDEASVPESKTGVTDSSDHSAAASTERIGRYEIIRMLGKGAFGKVFLARDPDLDRSVAIKVPTSKRIRMGGGVEEFLSEARAVAKLDHPNIVPVYDCGMTSDGHCFVVSKYVRGKELRAEIRKGISHREAAKIVCQLARALHAAHVAGIVHRDVKPSNVIIDSKRRPHLLDFGLAYQEQGSDEKDALIGTPAYMSPEQAEGGSHRLDGRSDIYSLAIIFYEMLVGHRPCKSEKAKDILAHLKLGEVRPPRQSDDTIPVELEEICLKGLSRQLSNRYSTAKDMADQIEVWLIETSTDFDSEISVGSLGSRRSVRRAKRTEGDGRESSFGTFMRSPSAITGCVILLAFAVVIVFTKPPFNRPSQNDMVPPDPMVQRNVDPESTPDVSSETGPRRIAVLGFRDLSNSPDYAWMSTGLTELITEELGKSEQLRPISCENVSLMKAELDLTNSDRLGASTLRRINQRIETGWVVLGSYTHESSEAGNVRLSITLQHTNDADRHLQFEETGTHLEWLNLVTVACARLRRELNVPPPSIVETGQLFPSAPSMNAAKDYYEGIASLRAFDPLDRNSVIAAGSERRSGFGFDSRRAGTSDTTTGQ